MAGRGPIYLDVRDKYDEFDTHFTKDEIRTWMFQEGTFFEQERLHRERGGADLRVQKSEWTLRFPGRLGSIRVDLDCRSTELEGLWAAGDTIISGCAMNGAMSANAYGRWGLPFAFVSALKAAAAIGTAVSQIPKTETGLGEQEGLREKVFAPQHSTRKEYEPWDAILGIQQVVIPIRYNLIRDGNRLEEGLRIIEEVKNEILPKTKAETPHDLLRYHEAKSMALCAEMTFRAALYRTESRGSHFREDYPERDDKSWLKWTVVQREGEGMTLSTEPVPTGT
jgi:succinate dehydrogenase/fumarate reductase flavoprotein subunit